MKKVGRTQGSNHGWTALVGAPLVIILVLPLVALATSVHAEDLAEVWSHRRFWPALRLSLGTSLVSVAGIVIGGTPLAWWLSRSDSRFARAIELMTKAPVVIPPAVVGVGLLTAFGRRGLLGPALESMGLSPAFSPAAVVIAQSTVAAPFFIQPAINAFGDISETELTVARTLGASRTETLIEIIVPAALPGWVAGATLAWARALGEFGATLIFAGNLQGQTQTLPLAIYTVLQSDIDVAIAFSLFLALFGLLLFVALRLAASRRTPGAPDA